ncbi:unnamed protein product, partial [Amoebophrya sp. A25]|eukprot:GSA25T00024011001.1
MASGRTLPVQFGLARGSTSAAGASSSGGSASSSGGSASSTSNRVLDPNAATVRDFAEALMESARADPGPDPLAIVEKGADALHLIFTKKDSSGRDHVRHLRPVIDKDASEYLSTIMKMEDDDSSLQTL